MGLGFVLGDAFDGGWSIAGEAMEVVCCLDKRGKVMGKGVFDQTFDLCFFIKHGSEFCDIGPGGIMG